MNDENLIPFNQRTASEQRDIARAGGIASGEARRERARVLKWLNDKGESGTQSDDIILNMIKAAKSLSAKDRVKAAEFVYRLAGEYTEKHEVETNITPADFAESVIENERTQRAKRSL